MLAKKRGYLLICFTILSLAARILFQGFEVKFWSDQQVQLIGAQSILEGHGVSEPMANPENMSEINFVSINQWPEGYSYLMSFFFLITKNLYAVVLLGDILALVIYFIGWYQLYRIFGKNNRSSTIWLFLTLLLGFSSSPYSYYTSTDLLSVACLFSGTILIVTQFYKKGKLLSYLGCLLLFFSGFFRFAYYPLMFVIPCILIIFSIYRNERRAIVYYSSHLLIVVVLLAISQLVQTHYNALPEYINGSFQLYWENLKKPDVFFPIKALIEEVSIYKFLKLFNFQNYVTPIRLIISAFILSVFFISVFLCFKMIKRPALTEMEELTLNLFGAFGIVLITNFFLVVFLSLITAPINTSSVKNWIFCEEFRYYAPAHVSILLVLLITSLSDCISLKLKEICKYIIILSTIIACIVFIPRVKEQVRVNKNYFRVGEQRIWGMAGVNDEKLVEVIKNKIELDKQQQIRTIYVSNNESTRLACLMGAAIGYENMFREKPVSKKPYSVIICISLKTANNSILQKFVENEKLLPIYKSSEFKLYLFKGV